MTHQARLFPAPLCFDPSGKITYNGLGEAPKLVHKIPFVEVSA